MPASEITPEDVIHFWIGDLSLLGVDPLAKAPLWWKKDEAFDREIRERFERTLERAARGELAAWESSARGRLALVLLFDQMSRNIFRGTARSFAQDGRARETAKQAFDAGDDRALASVEVSFVLMPFMHGEDLALQQRAIDGFIALRDAATDERLRKNFDNSVTYGKRHMAIIERFGRFPHRNELLGRASTPEEVEFLKQPGSSF
jgi:uncharacterized protein (DUF924 family)